MNNSWVISYWFENLYEDCWRLPEGGLNWIISTERSGYHFNHKICMKYIGCILFILSLSNLEMTFGQWKILMYQFFILDLLLELLHKNFWFEPPCICIFQQNTPLCVLLIDKYKYIGLFISVKTPYWNYYPIDIKKISKYDFV